MFGITRAPDFDSAGLSWFNVDQPLSLDALRGRLVILDFWTFCCINCMHVLPTLRRIEEAFPTQVAVIGVHSPKFAAERAPEKVAQAIARYDIRHPVVHDPQMALWDQYGVRAWPSLVFISPDGYVIGQLSGEPHPDLLLEGIGDMVRQFFERGELQPGALPLVPADAEPALLRFPGKIKSAPGIDKLWALADSGHHQIVLVDDDGIEIQRYGLGRPGFDDGDATQATFCMPQGLICSEEAIFVADTGNHAIRRIDRATGIVATVAGIGLRGSVLKYPEPAIGTALASPWDLELSGNRLFFANAGTHQLGELDLATRQLRPLAGSGGEDIVDGPAAEALLAQPSGLALAPDGQRLYFADSETSSVRYVTLDDSPRVETLVGRGLFEFGHRNGSFGEAALQHPLGLAALDGKIFVADSYNDRPRLLDLGMNMVADIEEPGFTCIDAVCRPTAEPAGIAADGPDRLLLSDTNNHRIIEYKLSEKKTRTWFG